MYMALGRPPREDQLMRRSKAEVVCVQEHRLDEEGMVRMGDYGGTKVRNREIGDLA
eukprot:c49978_g1_i1 orf=266-433(-)